MKTEIKFAINNKVYHYGIEAKNKGVVIGFPYSSNDKMPHYKYEIKVTNKKTGKTIKFNYYGSAYDFEHGKKTLSKTDLVDAFRFLLEDAISALDYDIDEFYKEFGFDKVSLALKVYKACHKQLAKTIKLGLEENDLYNILNFLTELESEDRLKDIIVK